MLYLFFYLLLLKKIMVLHYHTANKNYVLRYIYLFHDIHRLLSQFAAFFFFPPETERGRQLSPPPPLFSLSRVQSCLPQTKLLQVQIFIKPSVRGDFRMKQGEKREGRKSSRVEETAVKIRAD